MKRLYEDRAKIGTTTTERCKGKLVVVDDLNERVARRDERRIRKEREPPKPRKH